MVCFQEAKVSWVEVVSGDHVGVEAQILVVGVLVASVSLVAHCFDGKVGVIDFVYEVKNSQ